VADSDSTFITIAFSGSTTEPNARNSSTNVLTPVSSAIQGSVAPRLASSSTSPAVVPPTSTVAPAGGGDVADLGDDVPGRRGHRGRLVADVDAGDVSLDSGHLGAGHAGDGIDPVQVGGELGGRSCPCDERLDRSGGIDRELAVQRVRHLPDRGGGGQRPGVRAAPGDAQERRAQGQQPDHDHGGVDGGRKLTYIDNFAYAVHSCQAG
jgi:hypothetical protein